MLSFLTMFQYHVDGIWIEVIRLTGNKDLALRNDKFKEQLKCLSGQQLTEVKMIGVKKIGIVDRDGLILLCPQLFLWPKFL